mmetsp:Transcript_141937/g.257970  ORF Transcript_141937/g.257970 Transcript_141937/m.257970 type:complete len:241 (+) Transcript_141937:1297-2019(+)
MRPRRMPQRSTVTVVAPSLATAPRLHGQPIRALSTGRVQVLMQTSHQRVYLLRSANNARQQATAHQYLFPHAQQVNLPVSHEYSSSCRLLPHSDPHRLAVGVPQAVSVAYSWLGCSVLTAAWKSASRAALPPAIAALERCTAQPSQPGLPQPGLPPPTADWQRRHYAAPGGAVWAPDRCWLQRFWALQQGAACGTLVSEAVMRALRTHRQPVEIGLAVDSEVVGASAPSSRPVQIVQGLQ